MLGFEDSPLGKCIPLDFSRFLGGRYNVSIVLQRYSFFLIIVHIVTIFSFIFLISFHFVIDEVAY